MDDYCNILQIMPASDWLAEHNDSVESVERVVCFALVEVKRDGENFREVRAMVPDGKLISFADGASNFSGVRHATASTPA